MKEKPKNYSFDVVVLELAARDKCSEAKKWLDETFLGFTKIDSRICRWFIVSMQASIKWSSSFSNIVDSTGKGLHNQFLEQIFPLIAGNYCRNVYIRSCL